MPVPCRPGPVGCPLPELPASQFKVVGGSVYAGTPGFGSRTWAPEALWMPRASFGLIAGCTPASTSSARAAASAPWRTRECIGAGA